MDCNEMTKKMMAGNEKGHPDDTARAGERHREVTKSRRRSSRVSAALFSEVTKVLSTIHTCCLKHPHPALFSSSSQSCHSPWLTDAFQAKSGAQSLFFYEIPTERHKINTN